MEYLYFDQIYKRPFLIPALIGVSAVVTFLLNIYELFHGVTNVLPHLLYIPIILAAYYYPRRGVPFTLLLSALYFGAVFAVYPANADVQTSAVERIIVFLVIAAVISYLDRKSVV